MPFKILQMVRYYLRCSYLLTSRGIRSQSRDTKLDYEYFKALKSSLSPSIRFTEVEEKELKHFPTQSSSTHIVDSALKKLNKTDKEENLLTQSQEADDTLLKTQKIVSSFVKNETTDSSVKESKENPIGSTPDEEAEGDQVKINQFTKNAGDTTITKSVAIEIPKPEKRTSKPIALKINIVEHAKYSQVLQEFVNLGVDLSHWQNQSSIQEMILSKDFNRDIKPHIDFLILNGLPSNKLGNFFTKNPYILLFTIDNLKRRIDFYKSKNISAEMISQMMTKAVYILNVKTNVVNKRFEYYKNLLNLTDHEIQDVIIRQPKLITFDLKKIQATHEAIVDELHIKNDELKSMFLNKPKLWLTDGESIRKKIDYVCNEMSISRADISRCPEILLRPRFMIKQRHLFLQIINRANYDWPSENSIALKDFIWSSDEEFCKNVAQTSLKKFKKFLKTLHMNN